MRVLVTGGAGFIGCCFARLLITARPSWKVVVLDKLTYAGRMENLADVSGSSAFTFIKGDICDPGTVAQAMRGCDAVVNFAAETHVDRSIEEASSFVRTDIEGVRVLLEEFRREDRFLFLQISTDEVYGSVESGHSLETDPLKPRSPYSASKAGGELLAMSYQTTYGTPVAVTRASNNYGPFQYPEKLIPLFITNALDGMQLPLYGDGLNRRDWLFVEDHCRALLAVLEHCPSGQVFNIGGGCEKSNLEVTLAVLDVLGAGPELIRHIEDRPGHDRRYALDIGKITGETGWKPEVGFLEGIRITADWYRKNRPWWKAIKSGEFMEYYRRMYHDRLGRSRGAATE